VTAALASVVIPARNEEAVIGRTLGELTAQASPGELEIVVVCNGCRDRTAAVARRHPGVTVVEVTEGGKVAALRAGDRRASAWPRIYLDADVVLSTAAARALAAALRRDEPAVAGLRAEVDLTGASRGVRWFYDFRQQLPVFRGGVIGAGVYALNAPGRARFTGWPEVLGDDLFVLRLFEPDERVLVESHRTIVTAPGSLGEVVRRGVRVQQGNRQLDRSAPLTLEPRPPAGLGAALREVGPHPARWVGAATFGAVTAVTRLEARRSAHGGDWRTTDGEGAAGESTAGDRRSA
jgi:glycosyltransferase involved in cell wall biosynthesis